MAEVKNTTAKAFIVNFYTSMSLFEVKVTPAESYSNGYRHTFTPKKQHEMIDV